MQDLSDKELIETTTTLRGKEKELLFELLLHIGEIDGRGLYRDEGYPSLFVYLNTGLGYSKAASYRRVQVARLLRRFPEACSALGSESLSFSALVEISKVAIAENISELLRKCEGKSLEEVEHILLREGAHQPKRKECVKVVRTQKVPTIPTQTLFPQIVETPPAKSEVSEQGSAAEPSLEECFRLELEVDQEFMSLYTEVKALSGGNGMEGALKKVMKEYIQRNSPKEREKRRAKSPHKKPTPVSDKRSRHIPVQVRDQVYLRDRGRCTFVAPSGKRCCAREKLEYDHIQPYSLGGEHVVENLRLRCHAHNQLEAERVFGKEVMNSIRARG